MFKNELPPTNGLPLICHDLYSRPKQPLDVALSKLLNIPKPLLTCSGTVAFIVTLQTLHSIKAHKTHVIVPAWTCPLVVLAIEKINLVPVICDLEKDSLDLNIEHLQQLITPQTLAIVATHYAGLAQNIITIKKIAEQHQCFLIEDAAQSMGAKFQKHSVGLIGDVAFFSMAFGKGLTSAEGGVLFSQDPSLHQAMQHTLVQISQQSSLELLRCLELFAYYCLYHPFGLNFIYGYSRKKALKNHNDIKAVGDDFDQDSIPIHQLGQWRSQVASNASERLQVHWEYANMQAKQRILQLKKLPFLHVFEAEPDTDSTYPFILLLVKSKPLTDKI